MCRICKNVDDKTPEEVLAEIASAIKWGAKPEHFKKTLDRLLGTEEPAKNEEADDAFERAYRNNR